jgi:hypothetical protein
MNAGLDGVFLIASFLEKTRFDRINRMLLQQCVDELLLHRNQMRMSLNKPGISFYAEKVIFASFKSTSISLPSNLIGSSNESHKVECKVSATSATNDNVRHFGRL